MIFTFLFFFNDTATTEIYTLSLHDALPISYDAESGIQKVEAFAHLFPFNGKKNYELATPLVDGNWSDRKSTRLNSSHANISYAVFCLKKKNYQPLLITHILFDVVHFFFAFS